MNNVVLYGRVSKDLKMTGEVLKFSIAVQRDYKDKDGNYNADFINCVAFSKTAENIEKFFSKGSPIIVRGSILTGSYDNKEGKKVYTTEVKVDKFGFVAGGNTNKSDDDFAAPIDDGDMPF